MKHPLNISDFNNPLVDTQYYDQILLTERSGQMDFGCFMLFLDIPIWDQLMDLIDDKDLFKKTTHGKEKDPHTTILCGLRDRVIKKKDIENILNKINITANTVANAIDIKAVNYFKQKQFDVLKFEIESPLLHQMHAQLKSLPYDELWPSYKAHITIAYLNSGKAEAYIEKINKSNLLNDIVITNARYIYSDSNFNKTEF